MSGDNETLWTYWEPASAIGPAPRPFKEGPVQILRRNGQVETYANVEDVVWGRMALEQNNIIVYRRLGDE